MPRTLVQSLVEVIDACAEGIPYVSLDEANMQARGLLVLWLPFGSA